MMTTAQVSQYLKAKGIRPSAQRIAIIGYLMEHPVHPTAENIYDALMPDMPSLSLTTVYNTLNCLVSSGIGVERLNSDPRNARFDFVDTPHAHMYCRCCGAVMDLPLDAVTFAGMSPDGDFHVEQIELCYRGLCSKCHDKM